MANRLAQNLVACGVAIVASSGCTTQQAYSAGQEWQRNQCNRMIDNAERSRCLDQLNTSYADYKRQTEELKKQYRP